MEQSKNSAWNLLTIPENYGALDQLRIMKTVKIFPFVKKCAK